MRISNMKTAIRKAENDYLFGGQRRRRNHVQPRRFRTAPPLCRQIRHPRESCTLIPSATAFAINFLQENKDIALLADLMGHSGVNTTMIYLRLSKEEQRRAIDDSVRW